MVRTTAVTAAVVASLLSMPNEDDARTGVHVSRPSFPRGGTTSRSWRLPLLQPFWFQELGLNDRESMLKVARDGSYASGMETCAGDSRLAGVRADDRKRDAQGGPSSLRARQSTDMSKLQYQSS